KIYNEFKKSNSRILENNHDPDTPSFSTTEQHEKQSNVNNNNSEIKSSRCYETEKFDSNENIWHHSPPSSVIHCELMSTNNCVLDSNNPNLQVTTPTIE
ncbi:3275_t:CDS:2, partial [Racocetra fulgida]